MNYYPKSILELVKNFSKLPGIGRKTAERLAMHVVLGSSVDAEALAASILEVKKKVQLCSRCFALSDSDICGICKNPERDNSVLCVVEKPADMTSIEKSGAFPGLYHILQGVLSPVEGIGPDDIRIKELINRVRQDGIREVLIATSTTVEGEATALYIAEGLQNLQVRVTRIASGVPMGGDLKYVDQVTIKRAIETRHNLKLHENS